jgi:FkbM family methyltransferase
MGRAWDLYKRFRPIFVRLNIHNIFKKAYISLYFSVFQEWTQFSIADHTVKLATPAPHLKTAEHGEEEVLQQLLRELNSTDIFLDIGAHIGRYSCFVAMEVTNGHVVAIEPGPGVDALKQSVRENELENVATEQIFFGEESGTTHISSGRANMVSLSEDNGDYSVPVVRGDDFVSSNMDDPPSVIKIDVEGAEGHVVRGLQNTLEEHVRLVVVEVHRPNDHGVPSTTQYGDDPEDVLNVLRNYGFDCTKVHNRGSQEIYFARSVDSIEL